MPSEHGAGGPDRIRPRFNIHNASLGMTLSLLTLLFLAPAALLITLFIATSWKDVAFAQKESAGVEYLTEIWPSFTNLGAANSEFTPSQRFDDLFSSHDESRNYNLAAGPEARMATGTTLIIAAADGSNLTLDPDLDAYYAMISVTVRLPALFGAATDVMRAREGAGDPAKATDRLHVEFAGAMLALEKTMENNPSGDARRALSGPKAQLDDAWRAHRAATASRNPASARAADVVLLRNIDQTWKAAAVELSRMLDLRVQRLLNRMYINLILVAFALTGAVGLAVWIARSYSLKQLRAITDLEEAKVSAEAANISKSQFLANMSHEIRTPLNGVLGMAEVMALSPLSDVQRERLEVIQGSGKQLLSVLNDLLDLSKVEAGEMTLEAIPFDMGEVANGACAAFTSISNLKGIPFALTISEAAKGRWCGDSVRMRQIMYNLVANALKFTTEGKVTVAIDAVPHQGARALLITVSDTGIGIPADVIPKLFQKFVQADSTTTRKFGGTGLGLAICRHMAELMNGTITVRSVVGEGSDFEVFLPLTWLGPELVLPSPPGAGEYDDHDAAVADAVSRLRVLAAEDNPTNQLVLRTVLHAMGLEPVIVDDGRQAVDAWKAGNFDLILMDVQMPVLDGVLATQEIRLLESRKRLGRTRIIALSANAMKHQVENYIAVGMDGHVAKPIEMIKLYAAMVETVQSLGIMDTDAPEGEVAA